MLISLRKSAEWPLVKVEQEGEMDEQDRQIDVMIAIEESIREEDARPGFLDEDAYRTEIFIDDEDEVIFDTGCTAHVLRCGKGLFDRRKAPGHGLKE